VRPRRSGGAAREAWVCAGAGTMPAANGWVVRPTNEVALRPIPQWAGLMLLLSYSPLAGVNAQWPAEIVLGTRVQAQLPEAQFQPAGRRGHLLRGRVTALAPDTLYLAGHR
jgi:hypothetical protein